MEEVEQMDVADKDIADLPDEDNFDIEHEQKNLELGDTWEEIKNPQSLSLSRMNQLRIRILRRSKQLENVSFNEPINFDKILKAFVIKFPLNEKNQRIGFRRNKSFHWNTYLHGNLKLQKLDMYW